MKKFLSFFMILLFGVLTSACVNTFAVHELNQIAIDYMQKGDIQSAISRFESSIDLDDSIYESRYNLAVAYVQIGECEKAQKHIEAASKLAKDEPAVYYTLGVVNNCLADRIYEKKLPNGEIETIEYKDLTQNYTMAKQYIEYLKKANDSFNQYVNLVPNAEDSKDVLNVISKNNELIANKQSEIQ